MRPNARRGVDVPNWWVVPLGVPGPLRVRTGRAAALGAGLHHCTPRPTYQIAEPRVGLVRGATCFHLSATTPGPAGLLQEGRLRSPGFRKENRGHTRGLPRNGRHGPRSGSDPSQTH